jgi:indole-3-glycerol phosphate synthase
MQVSLTDWMARKKEELGRAARVDVRNVTPSTRDFTHAVSTQRSSLSVVAELARATPEEGHLAPMPDYQAITAALDDTELAAFAVATDQVVCQGSLPDLTVVSRAATSPVAQRDLVLVREQLYQARLAGADAVLLHAAAVIPGDLKAFIEIAASMHMSAPVEVRTLAELELAASAGARVVIIPAFGHPHASLSLDLAQTLLPEVPNTVAPLVRGPFYRPEELEPLRGKADGVWICEPVMRAGDAGAFMRELLAVAGGGAPP